MQTVLVAGGAGFIGSHLCERLLNEGYDVICVDNLLTSSRQNIEHLLDNEHFSFVHHNVIEPLPVHLKADVVFHLASPASPNHHSKLSYHSLPMETMLVNTQGTLELLKFTKTHNAKFLFASTSEVYGDPLVHPQPESYRGNVSTTGPRSVYDEAKRFGETLTAYFWRHDNVDTRIVRIFNTYGPNMQPDDGRVVSNMIMQALHNKPLTIYGNGSQTRSFCYVSDLVEGLERLMFTEGLRGEVVNMGNPNEKTIKEFATIIKSLTNTSSEIVFEPLPSDDPKKRNPDIIKAKRLLDWEPKVSLEEGLKKTIDYFKSL